MPTRDRYSYFVCPFCGAEVRVGTPGCPNCTASKNKRTMLEEQDSGPLVEKEAPGTDEDDDTFDYDAFLEREFGVGYTSRRNQIRRAVKATIGVLLIAAVGLLAFGLVK